MRTAVLLAVLAIATGLARPAGARERIVSGALELVQVDDFDQGRSRLVHRVHDVRTGKVFELALDDAGPVLGGLRLRTGMTVRVRGHVLRGVRRDRARVLVAGPGRALAMELVADAMGTAAVMVGARRALVMLVDFRQDGKSVACSNAAVAGSMFSATPSVDRMYQEASFGQLSWPADVDGNGTPDVVRVAIDDAGNDCDTTVWRSKADAAATAAGVTLSRYQHRVYVLPSTVACGWAGYAQVGCGTSCWAMVATCDRGDVYAHELGHNLGMYHASFDTNADGAPDASCPWGPWSGGGEYCDDSDVMGISTNAWRQTNGPHKVQLGWVPAAKIVDVAATGTYAVAPLETLPDATALPLVLRVPRAAGGPYYVTYRRRIGVDATMRSSYADRTSVHTRPSGNTLLVAVLGDAETFTDAAAGIAVSQLQHDGAGAQVRIALACGNGMVDAGEECDGANLGGATCGGCSGRPSCTPACRLDRAACTNGVCDATESTASCPQDCPACSDADGDGLCPADGDCNDADPAVRPGVAEACTGGKDEDCDGLVDCNDPACAAATGCITCRGTGVACTTNGQCCSRKCGGSPKRRTCR